MALQKRMFEVVVAEIKKTSGYDAPVFEKDQDDLDRWRLAVNVSKVVTNVPAEWSVRVGIYGRWGEGKTSVLKFLEKITSDDDHLIMWFNPWAANDQNTLWFQFALKLFEIFEKSKIKIDTVLKTQIKVLKAARKIKSVATSVSGANSTSKAIVGSGFALVENFLNVDSETLKNLRAKLGSKRVIVIIDDLDRTDPSLIPHILLSLREILDLPGFSFVLAFDNDIVAKALKEYHSAWGTGHDFLEKIIDFPFHLPPVTETQKENLWRRETKKDCSFIPQSAFEGIDDLLPENPRKTKLFIRSLALLEDEVGRHDPEELDWTSILISQLIKIESGIFLQKLIDDFLPKKMMSLAFIPLSSSSSDEKDESSQKIDKEIKQCLENCNIEGEKESRLKTLILAWVNRGGLHTGDHFIYQANLTIRPDVFTWKEFRKGFDIWRKKKNIADVEKWLGKHSKEQNIPIKNVSHVFFATTITYREDRLSIAAESTLSQDQEEVMKEAADALLLLHVLFSKGLSSVKKEHFSTSSNFKKVFDLALKWIHFRKNPEDQKARDEESNVLLEMAKSGLTNPGLFIEIIEPWLGHLNHIDEKKTLCNKLMSLLEPAMAEKALSLFEENSGISRLREYERNKAYKYVLFRSSSPLWKEPLLEKFFQTLKQANLNLVILNNCMEYVYLLVKAGGSEIGVAHLKDVKALLEINKFVPILWQSITAKKIQYRGLDSFRKLREKLVEFGAKEAEMPLPDWMKES